MVREKLFYGCSTPECKYEFGIKLVDGQLMRKILQPNHSAECDENNVAHEALIEAVVLEDDNKRASRKRVKDLMKFVKKSDDGSSESSDDDVPTKQSKKQDAFPAKECAVVAESEAAESELNSDYEVIIADPNADDIDG